MPDALCTKLLTRSQDFSLSSLRLGAALIFLRLVGREATRALSSGAEPSVGNSWGGGARLALIFKSKSPADECGVNTRACAGAGIIQPVMVLTLENDSNLKAL